METIERFASEEDRLKSRAKDWGLIGGVGLVRHIEELEMKIKELEGKSQDDNKYRILIRCQACGELQWVNEYQSAIERQPHTCQKCEYIITEFEEVDIWRKFVPPN